MQRPSPAVAGGERRQGHGSVKYFWRGEISLEQLRSRQAQKDDPGLGSSNTSARCRTVFLEKTFTRAVGEQAGVAPSIQIFCEKMY